jgi:hypothetical protein
MRLDGWTPLLVIVAGGLGGFDNALLGGVLRRPRKVTLPDGTAGYDLGWIGNVIIGRLSAFAFWAFGPSNPEPPAVYATALISGLGGARVLNDVLVKRNLKGTANGLAAELGATVPSAHG